MTIKTTTIPARAGHNGKLPGKKIVGSIIVLDDAFTHSALMVLTWYLIRKHPASSGFITSDGARQIRYLHQLVFEHYHGELPTGLEIDHIDRDPLNNVPSNLRSATRSLQALNSDRGPKNTSGYRGVCRFKNQWQANLTAPGMSNYIGRFPTKEDAARAVNKRWSEFYPEMPIPNPTVE